MVVVIYLLVVLVLMVKLATASASSSSEVAFDNTVFTSDYKSYMIRINDFVLSTNADFRFCRLT